MAKTIIMLIVLFVVGVIIGNRMTVWFNGYSENLIKTTKQEYESSVAKDFEKFKEDMLARDFKIQKEKDTIINNNKTVYSTVCVDESGIDLIKRTQSENRKTLKTH